MHSCRVRGRGIAETHGLGDKIVSTGAYGSSSDNIYAYKKNRVSCVSNFRERSQTNEAGLSSTTFARRALHNTKHFPHRNQKVAAGGLSRSRRQKIMAICPEEAGSKVATLSPFCASLLYGVFSEIPSEVRLRVHG